MEFRPIRTARFVELGTEADLLMSCGRIIKATWKSNGRAIAWYTAGAKCIPLYSPRSWRPVNRDWPHSPTEAEEAAEHAKLNAFLDREGLRGSALR